MKQTKILKNKDFSCFQTLRCCIYHADKCRNINNSWYFNIYEHDICHAQLSMKKVYYIRPRLMVEVFVCKIMFNMESSNILKTKH